MGIYRVVERTAKRQEDWLFVKDGMPINAQESAMLLTEIDYLGDLESGETYAMVNKYLKHRHFPGVWKVVIVVITHTTIKVLQTDRPPTGPYAKC